LVTDLVPDEEELTPEPAGCDVTSFRLDTSLGYSFFSSLHYCVLLALFTGRSINEDTINTRIGENVFPPKIP